MTQKSQQKWKIGTLCEVFSNSKQEWFNGKIVHRVQNYKGKWVKVKFGPGLMFEKLLPMNSADLRSCQNLSVQQSMQKQNSEEQLLTNIYDQLTSDNNNTKEYHCRKCGYINHTDSVNCNSCGQSLNECAHCTHVNDMDALVCALCHRSLSSYSRKLPPSRMKNANNIDVHKNIQLSIHGASYKLINFSLNWQHISNAIKHELYDTIASSFMDVVKNNKKEYSLLTYDNINYVLDTLKVVKNIKPNEIYYINQLINSRAKQFKPLKNTTDQSVMDDREYDETMTQFNGCIHTDFPDLNIQLLYDIYNVHNIFKFTNYQFAKYTKDQFIHDVEKNHYFEKQKSAKTFIAAIDSVREHLPTVRLFPQYVIDDDMYSVWNYFFATSYLVNKLLTLKNKQFNRDKFNVKITIIPNRVVSIYDENVQFRFNGDINEVIQSTKLQFIQSSLSVSDSKNQEKIKQQLEAQLEAIIFRDEQKISFEQLQIIVDRRRNVSQDIDTLYINASKIEQDELCELHRHYFMSLSFSIQRENVRCYLYYGLNKSEHIRFFPEYLVSVIPKFFKKDDQINYYDNIQRLYDDSYKHGFSLTLHDPAFSKYYKIITKSSHTSVNYNRNTTEEKKQMEKTCLSSETEIDECPFIQHIVEKLKLFTELNFEIDSDSFNVYQLNKCYNHIINIHLFCLNHEKRKDIQTYLKDEIGKCESKLCLPLKAHISRRREAMQLTKPDSDTDNVDILDELSKSCLNSLHCYLLHDDETLYRLKREDVDSGGTLRFATSSNPLQFTDEIDEFIQFILQNNSDNTFIYSFIQWLKIEQYDWESILDDIDCKQFHQSNIYLYLSKYKYQQLFDLICNKYFDVMDKNESNEATNNVNAINFGICVLQWLEYGDTPNHDNFFDEILNNKYRKITLSSFEEYKTESLILIDTYGGGYRFNLEEMMSIKLYTDTSKLTALFRQSHWNNKNMLRMKKEFYWWAITIYNAALYHSRPLPRLHSNATRPMKLYHGINTLLTVNEQLRGGLPKYHGPVSTTLVNIVAQQFSDGVGLLWSIGTTYHNPFNFVIGIDVSRISCHKNEAEVLLVDQYLHISATHNYADNQKKIDGLCSQLITTKYRITNKKAFWKRIGFILDEQMFTILETHPLLLASTKYKDKHVLQRLAEELNVIVIFDALKYVLSSYLFEDLKTLTVENNKLLSINNIHIGKDRHASDVRFILTADRSGTSVIKKHMKPKEMPINSFIYRGFHTQFIIPFHQYLIKSISLYIQPSSKFHYSLVKTFNIQHSTNVVQNNENILIEKVDYFLEILRLYKRRIYSDQKNDFYAALGIIYEDEWAKIIEEHALFTKYSNYKEQSNEVRILSRLVTELNITKFQTHFVVLSCQMNCEENQLDFAPLKISIQSRDQIINVPLTECKYLKFEYLKYKLLRIDRGQTEKVFAPDESIPILDGIYEVYLKNEKLFGDKYILLQTFSRSYTGDFIENLCVKDNEICLHVPMTYAGISKFHFSIEAIATNGNVYSETFRFEEGQPFNIPLINNNKLYVNFRIYAQPFATSLERKLNRVKSSDTGANLFKINPNDFRLKENQANYSNPLNSNYFKPLLIKKFYHALSQYYLSEDDELKIQNLINVNNTTNRVQIFSLSTVNITENGTIQASKTFQTNADDSKANDNILSNPAVIHIVAQKDIIINGTLKIDGGTIALFAGKKIINNGNISCGKNDKIFISAKSFKNKQNEFISPPIITNQAIDGNWYEKQIYKKKLPLFPLDYHGYTDKCIQLKVHSHRGHFDNKDSAHPSTLLNDNDNSFYWSKKGVTNGDWIVFKILQQNQEEKNDQSITIIRKFAITNTATNSDVSLISLSVGNSMSVDSKWEPLCENITVKRTKDIQTFEVNTPLLYEYFSVWKTNSKNKFDLLKMEILKNHGNVYFNTFVSFRVFGLNETSRCIAK
eukprot:400055_1